MEVRRERKRRGQVNIQAVMQSYLDSSKLMLDLLIKVQANRCVLLKKDT
jgi:hypothetical protein